MCLWLQCQSSLPPHPLMNTLLGCCFVAVAPFSPCIALLFVPFSSYFAFHLFLLFTFISLFYLSPPFGSFSSCTSLTCAGVHVSMLCFCVEDVTSSLMRERSCEGGSNRSTLAQRQPMVDLQEMHYFHCKTVWKHLSIDQEKEQVFQVIAHFSSQA